MNFTIKIESLFEQYGCIAAGIIAPILFWFYFPLVLSEDGNAFFRELLTTYATIATIFSGLLATATSNFMTHSSNEIIKLLKKHKFFLPIISFSSKATISNAVSAVFSMVLVLILKFYSSWNLFILPCCLWGMCAAYSFAAFIRVAIIFHLSSKKTFELENS